VSTGIKVTAKRGGASRQLDIEELSDDELHDLLKRSTHRRKFALMLFFSLRGYGIVQSAKRQGRRSSIPRNGRRGANPYLPSTLAEAGAPFSL